MQQPIFVRKLLPALICALGTVASVAEAAPTISRLTPPSNTLSADAVTLARFLPGQRFDLQATVKPDAGTMITTVEFKVDGVSVGVISGSGVAGNKSLVPASSLTSSVPNAVSAYLRGYANSAPGVHTLAVTATQSDGQVVSREGNFEVVGIVANNGRTAKNVIIMLGDGMGAAHRTAARIMAKGYAQGKAQGRLAMDTFPYTGMVMTASLDSIVTDSAPGMANYVTGNKAQNNQEGVYPDDTTDAFDNPRVEYLSEYLHRKKGTTLGIVTTADVFDATPAANAVHTSNRGNGTGIVDQFLDDRKLTGLTVLMGGGRKWFLPNASNSTSPQAINGSQRKTSTDYVLPDDLVAGWGAAKGKLDSNRDLIADFQAAGYAYAPDKTALDAAGVPDKLLGLFTFSNMNVALDKINARRGVSTVVNDYGFPDQPMLDEMTDKALKVLNKNNANGFVLMVEGASIDKQAHLMDSDRWILETIEFDRAIQKARDFATANPDTIVIVTADHECAGASIIGAYTGSGAAKNNVATYEAAKFPKYTINADGYPENTDVAGKMLIGYGANADRYETWKTFPQPAQDSQQPFYKDAPLNTYPANAAARTGDGFLISGQVSGEQAVHTATDIPLSAYGRGASLFTGVFDNTDVFFKLGQIAIGGAK
ncbi:alkaline phosphatase [Rhodocyclus tenuis]|uniref:Alkaline phosphatase n=1 Tax=Rhodocyclus tenuis TaxID=1066 RepID=A0A840GL06_RHOTE|nr:alkaline phosphatase [Rhodocyclus tenuis]MBB4249112.1 alkaline phosphatase [Rhodocyclus tenuis]